LLDALRESSAYAQAVQIAQQLKPSRHRYPVRTTPTTTTVTTSSPSSVTVTTSSPSSVTKRESLLEHDEAYFTYDDEERVTKPRDLI
jgi:hypothetical protein